MHTISTEQPLPQKTLINCNITVCNFKYFIKTYIKRIMIEEIKIFILVILFILFVYTIENLSEMTLCLLY